MLIVYEESGLFSPSAGSQHHHSLSEKSVFYAFGRVLYWAEKSLLFRKSELCVFSLAGCTRIFMSWAMPTASIIFD